MTWWGKARSRLLFWAQAAWLLPLLACAGGPGGGPNPAGPPAPIAEIPGVLQIPGDLSIDVDKTRSDGALGGISFLADPLENFSEEIAFSANLVFFANSRLAALLGPLSSITIPVDDDLHEMEAVIFIGSTAYLARLNFADFDLDGINGTEGCSGHTAALPICVRVWADDGTQESRLLGARFDDFPIPTNPGSGSLRGQDITFGGVGSMAQVAANYDHLDPEDRFTDSFFGFLEGDPENPTLPFSIRGFVAQLGPDPTALKTTNGNSIDQSSGSFGKGFGRWFENQDLWIGSFQSNDPPKDFRDQCALIPSGEGVDGGLCSAIGLNTDGLDFLNFTTISDLQFFDFPATAP